MRNVAEKARELVTKYRREGSSVDVHHIARQLGIQIVEEEKMPHDVSGLLLRRGERTIIGINKNHGEERKRFTIAHELGHYILHQGRALFVDRTLRVNFRGEEASSGTNSEEVEANRFAAELLMPTADVLREADRFVKPFTSTSETILYLAKIFKVSQMAMSIKLENLGLYIVE